MASDCSACLLHLSGHSVISAAKLRVRPDCQEIPRWLPFNVAQITCRLPRVDQLEKRCGRPGKRTPAIGPNAESALAPLRHNYVAQRLLALQSWRVAQRLPPITGASRNIFKRDF